MTARSKPVATPNTRAIRLLTDCESDRRLLYRKLWRSEPGGLTPVSAQVLRLWLSGRHWSEIAIDLDCAVKTVENHRANIYMIAGTRHPITLYRWARKHGYA